MELTSLPPSIPATPSSAAPLTCSLPACCDAATVHCNFEAPSAPLPAPLPRPLVSADGLLTSLVYEAAVWARAIAAGMASQSVWGETHERKLEEAEGDKVHSIHFRALGAM
jgi:hypothetical protein